MSAFGGGGIGIPIAEIDHGDEHAKQHADEPRRGAEQRTLREDERENVHAAVAERAHGAELAGALEDGSC